MRTPRRRVAALLALGLLAVCAIPAVASTVYTQGFAETEVFTGLTLPTAVRFAADGRVFVAEKAGRVKVFDSLTDTSPDLLVDLGPAVHGYWDRGLLGLAVDPQFPTRPYIYVLYTLNRVANDPGAPDPRWPADNCPNPPGATGDGCTVDGRISRFQVASDNTLVGGELVLVEERWCQQFPSHSVGDLTFDATGMLIASAGDGANFNFADFGQAGGTPGSPTPANVCGDPPSGVGGIQTPPSAEGGALRSQDVRTASDPLNYNGAVLRIDPDSGAAAPGNPLLGGGTDDDRLIAFGLRNPFRMTRRPGTNEIWIGDVGWGTWEEIDRILDTDDSALENFGWPCYEGPERQGNFDALDLDLCEGLYAQGAGAVVAPFFPYRHVQFIDPDPESRCSKVASSSVSGLAFYDDVAYPPGFQDALFLVDYARECLWVMLSGADGLPDPSTVTTIADDISNPVDLQVGPDGRLYYVDHNGGRVLGIDHFTDNTPPTAIAVATPDSGPVPLFVTIDASGSYDDNLGDILTFEWDADDDGEFDDATGEFLNGPLGEAGVYRLNLRVTDLAGASDETSVQIVAGNTRPTAQIVAPSPGFKWSVGQTVTLVGSGFDAEDGAIDPADMEWEVVLHHCPGLECHAHPLMSVSGVDQVTFDAPDHEWYSYLGVTLRVTDSGIRNTGNGRLVGTAVQDLQPHSTDLFFSTDPLGLQLALGGLARTAPFVQTLIVGSINSLAAPSPQSLGGDTYVFRHWSDGGAAAHQVVAVEELPTLTATYSLPGACLSSDVTCDGQDDDCDGEIDEDASIPDAVPALICSADDLDWQPIFAVTGHDVVRGDLGILRATGGDFEAAVDACLGANLPGTLLPLGEDPAPGGGFWYLVRGRNCAGPAGWDSGGAGQIASRDAGIDAASATCP